MADFKCPLTSADYQTMREISQRCQQRKPFIEALNDLGIDTKGLEEQNRAQQQFCDTCERLHAEGVF